MSESLANVHDAFFKQVLSDPLLAGTFLREHLPPEVASLLGPEPPEPVPGSFVDEDLRQHHSDLVFRLQLKAGRGAFAYVLMEHKSSPDRGARLQLLRYVVRMLIDWYDRNKQQLPLPPVLPLLAHQGPQGWTFSCEFIDLFGDVPEALRPFLPNFRHALVDFARIDDGNLSDQVRLRAFLKALKYSRRPDLPDYIDLVLAEAPVLGQSDLFVILTYLDKVPAAFNGNRVREALQRFVPKNEEQNVGWLMQALSEIVLERCEAKGKVEGEATILSRMLEKRFGEVPSDVRERIFAANVTEIEAWVERAFDAPDLKSVFE